MDILQFEPLRSFVIPEFWHRVVQLKTDLGLSPGPIAISGRVRGRGRDANLPLPFFVDGTSFSGPQESTADELVINGLLYLYNTSSDLSSSNKKSVLESLATEIYSGTCAISDIDSTCLQRLNSFAVVCYANLKSFDFSYQFVFPVLLPPKGQGAFKVRGRHQVPTSVQIDQSLLPICMYDPVRNVCAALNFKELAEQQLWCTIKDFSVDLEHVVSWTARNTLIWLKYQLQRYNCAIVTVLFWRTSPATSLLVDVALEPEFVLVGSEMPPITGWERDANDKNLPRSVNLASSMDPRKLAEFGARLNVDLMKWRMVPELEVDRISSQRCLLLGMGTLGTYLSRLLVAWGVRNMTLVDSGTVSFSNPVRQCLYTFSDASSSLTAGKFTQKAVAASDALKQVLPTVNAIPDVFDIPMPGHGAASLQVSMENIARLEESIKSHDVIFLLLDSREARYFPTVFSLIHAKLVINVALGFDSFVVMHHGIPSLGAIDAGCYFCNDIVPPVNTSLNKTLDQQCTVTRPGVATIAAGYAVELFSGIVSTSALSSGGASHVLGEIPHQIRGALGDFSIHKVTGSKSSCCIACSIHILDYARQNQQEFVQKALSDSHSLEVISGLSDLKKQAETKLSLVGSIKDDIEWDI